MAGMIVAESVRVQTAWSLARQLPQKLPLVHAVLEGFTAVDEHHWDFVIELPPQFVVATHIYLLPRKSAAAGELDKALLHNFAEVTALARVNHDLARVWHGWIVALPGVPIPL